MPRTSTKIRKRKSMAKTPLGKLVEGFMFEHGLTQKRAKEWANVSSSTMNKITTQGGTVRAETLRKISDASGIPYHELMIAAGYLEENAVVISGKSLPIENPIEALHLTADFMEAVAQLPADVIDDNLLDELTRIEAAKQLIINKIKKS